ncbi:DUF1906 domain-containing protein [Pseudovibrio exalbescens]|uniref:Rv2525c-like glycoside hydrolase-like domain-containing protein n=1 Tax=Pseudovibrio exalbescens TaxID=197461 RepID=A0A1U7JLX9_9HYPH|nr:DUF1906 domain-containing protein [Pseudovibrio exalbescens]OKL45729.1 hypothetical protein A3843_01995 [Pseudovibrio exalbescens]
MTERFAIDTTTDLSQPAAWYTKHNIVAVGRYLSKSSWKRIDRSEAENILSMGLDIFTVYQDAQNQPADFNATLGTENAQLARQQAATLVGQPPHTAIYFAVDYDASEDDYVNRIRPYFQAVNKALAEKDALPVYRPGVYGSGLICQNLLDDQLVAFAWLSESTGYRDHQQFYESYNWNLAQFRPQGTNSFDGNRINPYKPDFGGFGHLVPVVQTAA